MGIEKTCDTLETIQQQTCTKPDVLTNTPANEATAIALAPIQLPLLLEPSAVVNFTERACCRL